LYRELIQLTGWFCTALFHLKIFYFYHQRFVNFFWIIISTNPFNHNIVQLFWFLLCQILSIITLSPFSKITCSKHLKLKCYPVFGSWRTKTILIMSYFNFLHNNLNIFKHYKIQQFRLWISGTLFDLMYFYSRMLTYFKWKTITSQLFWWSFIFRILTFSDFLNLHLLQLLK
jgi:hypothetical protein